MFNFRKPKQEPAQEVPPIAAPVCARMLHVPTTKFIEYVQAGHLPPPINPLEPAAVWRWNAAEIAAVVARFPDGYEAPEASTDYSSRPVKKQRATITIYRAAELIQTPVHTIEAIIENSPPGAGLHRVRSPHTGMEMQHVMLDRLLAYAKENRKSCVPFVEEHIRQRKATLGDDGFLYVAA